jgi:hypothetical protein
MNPRTLNAAPMTRSTGFDTPDCAPANPSIPRTIDGIEQHQSETLDMLTRMEAAIDGDSAKSCGVAAPSAQPGILERLGTVNHTSLEIRQRLGYLLSKLSKD